MSAGSWFCLLGLLGSIYVVAPSFMSVIQILSSASCYPKVLQEETQEGQSRRRLWND